MLQLFHIEAGHPNRIGRVKTAFLEESSQMTDIIERFGRYITGLTPKNPDKVRSLLLTAYRTYGLKLQYGPNKLLPPSRQKAAVHMNHVVTSMLSHPEKAALVSVFMPCELLEAMDILPLCAELYSCFINGTDCEGVFAEAAEAQGIAETYCSYHKVLLGSAYSHVLPSPSMVVNTSLICDANNLTFRELSDFYKIPHFYVDVPSTPSPEALSYVAGQFRELASFLEESTGRRLDEERLRQAVSRSRDTINLLRQCLVEKRAHSLYSDVTSELYEIYLAHNGLGSKAACLYAEELLSDLKAAPKATGTRLLWLHTIPNWQAPIRELFDTNDRYQILACDMNLESLVDMDPEKPYESMARRLVYSAWNTGDARIGRAIEVAKLLRADGVVCFCHWGCKQTMGLSARFKQELEREGFPTLILNGDGCDRRNASDGQVSTRLGAFLEMLEEKK